MRRLPRHLPARACGSRSSGHPGHARRRDPYLTCEEREPFQVQADGLAGEERAAALGTALNGFLLRTITGDIRRNTAASRGALDDARALFTNLHDRPSTASAPATLQGRYNPGVYVGAATITIRGTLTLDARTDSSARFIFRADRIVMAQNVQIVLTGGASLNNVYWRAAQTIEIASGATARGAFLAGITATLNDSQLAGRAVALNGTVTLSDATIGP